MKNWSYNISELEKISDVYYTPAIGNRIINLIIKSYFENDNYARAQTCADTTSFPRDDYVMLLSRTPLHIFVSFCGASLACPGMQRV